MRLFQVLDLLAELIDHRLQLEADRGEPAVVRLGAERVDLAVELLGEEVEPASDRAALRPAGARGRDMRVQPVDLLADIGRVASSTASW